MIRASVGLFSAACPHCRSIDFRGAEAEMLGEGCSVAPSTFLVLSLRSSLFPVPMAGARRGHRLGRGCEADASSRTSQNAPVSARFVRLQ